MAEHEIDMLESGYTARHEAAEREAEAAREVARHEVIERRIAGAIIRSSEERLRYGFLTDISSLNKWREVQSSYYLRPMECYDTISIVGARMTHLVRSSIVAVGSGSLEISQNLACFIRYLATNNGEFFRDVERIVLCEEYDMARIESYLTTFFAKTLFTSYYWYKSLQCTLCSDCDSNITYCRFKEACGFSGTDERDTYAFSKADVEASAGLIARRLIEELNKAIQPTMVAICADITERFKLLS